MRDIHALINELGARLDEEDRNEARIILNNLYLNGYDDLFICIALIRVLAREDFNRNRYLFSYQPFLDEVNELKNKYKKLKSHSKDIELYAVYHSSGDTIKDYDRTVIDEYFELPCDSVEDKEIGDKYLDYLYMKYCFSYSILNCNLKKYEKIILGTNERGFSNF